MELIVDNLQRNIYFQKNPEYFSQLKALVEKYPRTYVNQLKSSGKYGKSYRYLLEWIDNCLPQLNDFKISTKCYWIFHSLETFPLCENCKKPIKINLRVTDKYQRFCSRKCQLTSERFYIERLKTWKEKYGKDITHPLQVESIQQKIKQTNQMKYGKPYIFQNKVFKDKAKQTCLENFGVDFPMQSETVQIKSKQTKLKHFGDENFSNPEKTKRTKFQRYGDEKYVNSEKMKKTKLAKNNGAYESEQTKTKRQQSCLKHYRVKCSLQANEVKEKTKQTCLNKYGTEIAAQSDVIKQKIMKTCLQRYGKSTTLLTDKCKQKSTKTCIKKYGKAEFRNSEKAKQTKANFSKERKQEIKDKTENTNILKYGYKSTFQNKEIQTKIKETLKRRYNVENPSQCHELRSKAQKSYKYEGVYFSSIPELAYYIWLKDNNIKFEYQPKTNLTYIFAGKLHKYEPDFLVEGQLVEIKGDQFFKEDGTMQNPFNHKLDTLYEAKHQCMLKNNVKIITSKQYEVYVNYVKDKYGNNYLKQFKQV